VTKRNIVGDGRRSLLERLESAHGPSRHFRWLRKLSRMCIDRHQYIGDGRQTVYASLVGSRSVADPDGGNVTQIVLNGAKYRIKDQNV
jgi:hypothetical protein